MKSGKAAFVEVGGQAKYPREPAGLGGSDPAWAEEQDEENQEEYAVEQEEQEAEEQYATEDQQESGQHEPEADARGHQYGNQSRLSNTSKGQTQLPRFYNFHAGEEENSQGHRQILIKVFQTYTSFGERTNLKHLRSNKFHKMISDCGIPLDKTTADLLFVSENKHK